MIGVIYKIYCKDTNITDCYIGSTKNLNDRKKAHKCRYNKQCNYKLYNFIRNNGGYNNFNFEILKEVYEGDLKHYEREYIENLKPTLNKDVPGRTEKESKIAYRNSEKGIQTEKEYEENYKHIRENRAKQKIECECGCIVRKDSLLRHKKSKKHIDFVKNKK
jgi:hypothetical protein